MLVEMIGNKNVVGVNAVFGEESGLRKLTMPYESNGGVQETDEEKADRALDDAIHALASTRLRNTVRSGDDHKFSIDVQAIANAKPIVGVEAHVQLLSKPGKAHSLPPLDGPPAIFTDLDLTEITPFVIIHARDERGEQRCTVVCAELLGDRDHRRDAVLARQIDTPEKFLRFLHLMLSFGGAAGAHLPVGSSGGFGSWSSDGAGVFETLVRSLAENPEGLDDLARLVERMRDATSSGSLPAGFDELWEPVWRARLAQKGSAA
jgi:hypothetical protein